MGLFISRQIVLGHGGAISVRSREDEGTTFIVRLPRRPSANRKRGAAAKGSTDGAGL
ncbi:MAG: ATP-binding protein [Cystobacter sp.]